MKLGSFNTCILSQHGAFVWWYQPMGDKLLEPFLLTRQDVEIISVPLRKLATVTLWPIDTPLLALTTYRIPSLAHSCTNFIYWQEVDGLLRPLWQQYTMQIMQVT